jgi:hypothetical protein
MKINRLLLATTFTSLFLFGTTLFAQQDVNPSWYDPFPEAANATAPSHAVKPANQPKSVSGLAGSQLGQSHAKRVSQQSGAEIANGQKATMSQKSQLLSKDAVSTSKSGIDQHKVGQVSLGDGRHAASSPAVADETAKPMATAGADEVDPRLEATR